MCVWCGVWGLINARWTGLYTRTPHGHSTVLVRCSTTGRAELASLTQGCHPRNVFDQTVVQEGKASAGPLIRSQSPSLQGPTAEPHTTRAADNSLGVVGMVGRQLRACKPWGPHPGALLLRAHKEDGEREYRRG